MIPAGNVKRVIRALEYYEKNGTKISEHNREQRMRDSAYHAAYFVLTEERNRIYERINRRVDRMMEDGLIVEEDTAEVFFTAPKTERAREFLRGISASDIV